MVDFAANDLTWWHRLGTFEASTKRKLTCELFPLCSLGGAEYIWTMHVVNKRGVSSVVANASLSKLPG